MNSFNFHKPPGAVNISFHDYQEPVFEKYIENPSEETLYEIVPMQVAHTIDVIFKNCVDLYENEYLKLTSPWERAACVFSTPYNLFNINKVFFGEDVKWRIPFTVESDNCGTNFNTHNYFYCTGSERLDGRGLICNFYQDLDIMSTPETWKKDLVKALYRVVMGAYSAWKTWSITHPKPKHRPQQNNRKKKRK